MFTGQAYKLRSSFAVISDVYRSLLLNEITSTKYYCLTRWISKFPRSFEIHWVRQYLVNFVGLVGIVNANVYKTEPFSQGSGMANFPNFLHWYSLHNVMHRFSKGDEFTISKWIYSCNYRQQEIILPRFVIHFHDIVGILPGLWRFKWIEKHCNLSYCV